MNAAQQRTGPLQTSSENTETERSGTRFSNRLLSRPTRPFLTVVSVSIALTLLAVWTRRHNLGPSTLTHDGAWVAYIYSVGYTDALIVGLTSPGFVVLERLWLDIVGFSELRAQLLPWVAGIAAPCLLFVALRHRVRPALAALAGFLLAFTPIAIVYSSHVKQYTGEVLFGIALVAAGWRLLDDVTDRRAWTLLSTVTVLGTIFSFPVAIAAAGPLLAATLKSAQNDLRSFTRTLRWTIPTAVFVGLWYLVMLRPRIPDGLGDIWGAACGGEGCYIATDGGVTLWIESLLNRVSGVTSWLVPLEPRLVAAVGLVLLIFLALRRPFIFTLCATPLAAAVILASLDLAPLGGARTDMYFHAQLLTGMIVGLDEVVGLTARLGRRWQRSSQIPVATLGYYLAAAAAIAVGTAVGVTGYTPPPYPLQDIAPLIRELEAERAPSDVVFVEWEAMYHMGLYGSSESEAIAPLVSYGYRHYWVDFADNNLVRIHDPKLSEAYVEQIPADTDHLWFLVSQNPYLFHTRAKWAGLDQVLIDSGWKLTRVEDRQAAILELWVRS